MLVGYVYLLLSLAAIIAWQLEPSCASGACSAVAQLESFLGRPWWLWGALFYAVAGVLCLGLPKNRLTGIFLAAGAVFHAGLVGYGYAVTRHVCPFCWKFAVMGTLLVTSYWVLPGKKPGRTAYISAGPARALVVITLVLLVINPGTKPAVAPPAATVAMAAGAESQSGSFVTGGPKAIEGKAHYQLRVSTPGGAETYLDLREKPALFFAVWCPHCPEALKDLAMLSPEKRPYLVVTYPRDGDEEKAERKLAENGLAGELYYLAEKPPESVQGVPALVWMEGSELRHVEGAGAIAKKLRVPKLLGSAEISNPPDGGGKNVALAAALINGKIIQPGEVFSFNRTVGPRTVSRGFVEGRSIVETVYGPKAVPDVGGGVCRTATALHLAVLKAGLQVVERHDHSMPVNYAGLGKDAAVAWPYWDFKFKNTSRKTLAIKARSDHGKLRVELWALR
ncbi:VanW family protein [Desulfofundulus kuznetsovii DSM 6115]|uniref:VanW family protein n=1 Tax=Desulfofundulus kuznetsovii (strain DSM 6115 / VKM B-1805 / 17) TaxID=760568 RepID=A0AAU8Q078_DESK7|nr:VanW family protein [Desulfofundulus kuznetsovii DSM 6115]